LYDFVQPSSLAFLKNIYGAGFNRKNTGALELLLPPASQVNFVWSLSRFSVILPHNL
jgi:hypothetical protein